MGIHHRNEYNRFNLVDDLIEPIRPIVDYYVYYLLDGEKYFTAYHRQQLINLLNHKIKYRNKNMYITNMLEEYVSQYAAKIAGNRKEIDIPDIMGYEGECI